MTMLRFVIGKETSNIQYHFSWGWTDRRTDAQTDMLGAMRQWGISLLLKTHPSPSLPSKEVVDFITPSYSFVSSPLSFCFLISLHFESDSLLLSSTRFEKIKLLLIGGADDHTVSPALLSVFYSYLAHSARLPSSLCVWVDFCRFISKLNCFASD